MTGFVRGDLNAILRELGLRYLDPLYRSPETQRAMLTGIGEIQGGAQLTKVLDTVFEVVEPPMTVEQDVYGCEYGRECTDVADSLRPAFEELIRARTANRRGIDDRHFHWFWRLDRRIFDLSDVRTFVMETLNSQTVVEAAEILVGNAYAYTRHDEIDMHITVLPDRIRIRVDDDGPRDDLSDARSKPVPSNPGPDGTRRGGLAIIDQQSLAWRVIGTAEHGWSVLADFPRSPDDPTNLVANFKVVQAKEIPPGAYVYRADNHLAWVPVGLIEIEGRTVYLTALDGYRLPSFKSTEPVPIFASDEVVSSWTLARTSGRRTGAALA